MYSDRVHKRLTRLYNNHLLKKWRRDLSVVSLAKTPEAGLLVSCELTHMIMNSGLGDNLIIEILATDEYVKLNEYGGMLLNNSSDEEVDRIRSVGRAEASALLQRIKDCNV